MINPAGTNGNVLITGQPGAGKSTLARWLARRAYRPVVLDPMHEYDAAALEAPHRSAVLIVHDLDSALDALVETRDEPAAIVFRPDDDADPALEYEYFLRGVEAVQRNGDAGKLALIVDESSLASDTHDMLPQLHRLYNMGRKWNVAVVLLIQVDTDVHRVTRRNAAVWVAMQQVGGISTDQAKRFAVDAVANLQPLTPGVEPELGKHYLTYRPGFDLGAFWYDWNWG